MSDTLKALEESDFIIRYNPYGMPKNIEKYKLIDNFCLFWDKYVEPSQKEADFMSDNMTSDILKSWKGVAFEEVCWQHVPQIKRALEVGGVKSSTSIWNVHGDNNKEGYRMGILQGQGETGAGSALAGTRTGPRVGSGSGTGSRSELIRELLFHD